MRRIGSVLGVVGAVLVAGAAFGVPADEQPAVESDARPAPPPQPSFAPSGGEPSTPVDVDLVLRRFDAEEKAIGQELARIDGLLSELEQRTLARGRTYYKKVRAGLLPAGGGFDELVDHAAAVERARLALARDLQQQKELQKRRSELGDRLTQLKASRAPLEVHREAVHRAKTALRQAEERRMAFDRAFESSTGPSDYVAIYGADLGPSDQPAPGGFASLVGKLPLPLSGRAEVRAIEKQGVVGPALELKAMPGATARTVAPGRVVFADRYDDELVTVIVDHGDRYFSVYGNLSRAEVRVGNSVDAGAIVGPVARRGREGTILWFELRHGGQTIEPGRWFGL
jgi:murein DD-endopeptidase MepM/ murein hydrolase activator NlpD